MLDLLFRGASVVDGSGESARNIDVGVKDGRITLDVAGKTAKETIDATGLTLCPGFIDAHSHGDMGVGSIHNTTCKVSQGVTTEIGGQCGESAFPIDLRFEQVHESMMGTTNFRRMPWRDFENFRQYADYANNLDLSINMCALIGHSTLRMSVMGVENRKPTAEELELMKERLKVAMEQGAMGLSSGLIYIPGVYADTEELVELCKVIKPYGGIYATHMRSEGDTVLSAIEEAITVAETAGVPLVISHHKVSGRANWGRSVETLALVENAVARGVKIMLDQYPYEASMTSLKTCIPPQYFADGIPALMEKLRDPQWRKQIAYEMYHPTGNYSGFESSGGPTGIFISACPNVPEAEGMFISEYAEKTGKDPVDAYFDLLLANDCLVSAIFFTMDIKDVERIYCHPLTAVGSDGLCYGLEEKAHPRAWGTFIRPLREFAEEKHLVTFEQAVRKQTAQAAEFWGLKDRGRIAEGYYADLVLLDRSKLCDRACYQDSNQKADGIEAVYVMGQCVYRDKELTGVYPGRLLRRGE